MAGLSGGKITNALFEEYRSKSASVFVFMGTEKQF